MTTGQITSPSGERAFGLGLNMRTLLLISVVFGLLVSGYLSYVKLVNVPMACVEGHDQIEGFRASDLAHHEPIRSHAQRVAYQFP